MQDFVTLRRRFDKLLHLPIDHESELKSQEEKYIELIKERQIIENQIEEIKQSESFDREKVIPFPLQSFLNLRYWRKPPKTLKIFFQALACLFSITKHDFLTELKLNHHHLYQNQPSAAVMDEFRMKYFNLKEISPEYIRNKSLDAYLIAIWMHNIEENERLHRIKQPQIERRKQLENKLIQLNLNLVNKQKEIETIAYRQGSIQSN